MTSAEDLYKLACFFIIIIYIAIRSNIEIGFTVLVKLENALSKNERFKISERISNILERINNSTLYIWQVNDSKY